jgi:hypothetical protein
VLAVHTALLATLAGLLLTALLPGLLAALLLLLAGLLLPALLRIVLLLLLARLLLFIRHGNVLRYRWETPRPKKQRLAGIAVPHAAALLMCNKL